MDGYATRRALLRRMLAILTSALLVLLLAGVGLAYVAQSTERANDAALAAMVDTRSGRDLLSLLVESASAHRSLLLTGDPSHLAARERTQRALPGTRQRFADALQRSGHQADAQRVAEAVDARLAFETETLHLLHAGQREEVLRRMSSGEGHRLMEEVRSRVSASELHQDTRLQRLLAETHETAASFALMLLIAVVVLFFLLALGLSTTRADMLRLDREERALIDRTRALELDQSALKTMVETSADAVRNLAALEREAEVLKLASTRDPLTELLNRRGFTETVEPLLATLHAEGRPATLMFADLDGLKAINDSFGHDAGDEAIQQMAKLLVRTFRATDVLARLGGDEFLVLAVDADAARGAELRERVMSKIAARNAEPGHRFALGMSIGLVSIDPARPRPLSELISDADAAMYALKRSRLRDRTTLH